MPSSEVIRDLVVVLPGIMGSTLAKNGNLVWAPSAGSVLTALATFCGSIRELALPANFGDGHPKDCVLPVALMPDLHLIPGIWSANIGYDKLIDWLRVRFDLVVPSDADPARIAGLLPVPYDWRLSNRYNGKRLKSFVEPALERFRSRGGVFADAKIIFICHSMGGLVARWYIEKEGGAALTRKLVTLGTPYRGALSALDQLVNGVRKGIGPIKFDLTTFARSLPSIHQLLPEYACIESPRGLLKTTEIDVPNLCAAMAADGMKFHDEIDEAALARTTERYDIHPIVGFRQPTSASARIVDGVLEALPTIDGDALGGDATVPRLAGTPKGERLDSPIIRSIADHHGSLQSNQAALDEIEGVLSAKPIVYRAVARHEIGVRTEPLVLAGEPVVLEARVAGGKRLALEVRVFDEQDREATRATLRAVQGVHRASIASLAPGAYRIVVGGVGTMAQAVAPVTTTVLVWSGAP